MASIIDSREEIAKLDISNVLGSIENLPDQIEHAWKSTKDLNFSHYADGIENIVVAGMGGSALGAHVIKNLYKEDLSYPMDIINHYQLPKYTNNKTLVLLSSYSGTTEEVLAAAKSAEEKGAKVAIITSGGDLKELAQKNDVPHYIIEPEYNPSGQPRMAIGYSVLGMLGLFRAMGIISLDETEVKEVINLLQEKSQDLKPENSEAHNPAKHLAYSAVDRVIYLISAEHLTGAAHVFNNQINENAKQVTVELVIPEMNHHYMEALSHPTTFHSTAVMWFFNSKLYYERIQNRIVLTQMVADKKHFATEAVLLTADTKLAQVFELIQLGAYTNFYLSMLNGIDPAPIPTVDYFKQQLKDLN